MNKCKVLCIVFTQAASYFIARTIKHIVNTGECVITPILLALGCICISSIFHKRNN